MYLKLSLRNAKRSVLDYLLYIATMTILVAIMCISNSIAVLGNAQAGFQTASLPLLIVLIMVALVNFINAFMLKQRAKELANYMLLGMEKRKLTQMFLMEFCFIGLVCFVLGVSIGIGIYLAAFPHALYGAQIEPMHIITSILQTFLFFAIVEILSGIRIRRKIYKLQIRALMDEHRRNQPLEKTRKGFWFIAFAVSFSSIFLMLCGIVFLPERIAFPLISFIAIPLLCCIFSFYKWLYGVFSAKRLAQSENLYQGNHLYRIADMTTKTKTDALMSAVFCSCLFFSAMSFVFGIFLFHTDTAIMDTASQQWMGFLQISICVIFIAIYFSILSLQQIIALKQQADHLRILHYLGKSKAQIKALIKVQIMLALSLPTLMCFIVLVLCTPFINYKMNMIFPATMYNLLIKAIGGFAFCFVLLYLCYFLIVYIISKRYMKNSINL